MALYDTQGRIEFNVVITVSTSVQRNEEKYTLPLYLNVLKLGSRFQ